MDVSDFIAVSERYFRHGGAVLFCHLITENQSFSVCKIGSRSVVILA